MAELAPGLVVVNIDADPGQAVSLIQTILQNNPEVAVLPGQPGPRQLDHPPGDPRRGPRVPHPAAAGRRAARDDQPPAQPPRRRPRLRPSCRREGAAGHRGHRRGRRRRLHHAGRQPGHDAWPKTSAARGRARRLRPDARLGRRLPRHHPRPHPAGRRPEHRPARPHPAQAVDDPARLGPLRACPTRSRWRTPPRSTRSRSGASSACSRPRSPPSSSTPARGSSRPTSSPSRWPT